MKKLVLLILLVLTIGCQREKVNEVGVGYNKSLIVPTSNDLPEPGAQSQDVSNTKSTLEFFSMSSFSLIHLFLSFFIGNLL